MSAVMTFGKFKGQKVEDLIRSQPGYLKWAHENVSFFKLTQEQYSKVCQSVRQEVLARIARYNFTSPGLVIRRSRKSNTAGFNHAARTHQRHDYDYDDPMTFEDLHGWGD